MRCQRRSWLRRRSVGRPLRPRRCRRRTSRSRSTQAASKQAASQLSKDAREAQSQCYPLMQTAGRQSHRRCRRRSSGAAWSETLATATRSALLDAQRRAQRRTAASPKSHRQADPLPLSRDPLRVRATVSQLPLDSYREQSPKLGFDYAPKQGVITAAHHRPHGGGIPISSYISNTSVTITFTPFTISPNWTCASFAPFSKVEIAPFMLSNTAMSLRY